MAVEPPDDDDADGHYLNRRFVIEDPNTLEQLRLRPPQTTEVPKPEFFYNTKASKVGRVRCAHCKDSFANHFIGVVLQYSTGERILVGHVCGRNHYGVREFKRMLDDLKRAQTRAYYLHRRKAALASATSLLAALEKLRGHRAFDDYEHARQGFRDDFSLIAGVVRYELIRHKALTVQVSVRDIAAEERRDDDEERRAIREGRKWEPPASPRPITRSDTKIFGVLRDSAFFSEEGTPGAEFDRHVGALKTHLQRLGGVKTTDDLRKDLRRIDEAFSEIREQLARLAALPSALSMANLLLLASWATERQLPGTYRAEPTHLAYEPADEKRVFRLAPPPANHPPDDGALVEFERALDLASQSEEMEEVA